MSATRMMIVDPRARHHRDGAVAELAALLDGGDLLVVNDAATLPASLRGAVAAAPTANAAVGAPVELRLLGPPSGERGTRFTAVLFGAGDHTTRTEDRPPPPPLPPGSAIVLLPGLAARVVAVSPLSPRLVDVELEGVDGDAMWAALYRAGRPVQYAYEPAPLPLWDVQTVYAARPWAAEMPSAGRPLTWELLLALRRRGVAIARLTHAAGLSATGDPALDAALPLPELYDIPDETARAVVAARRRRGRVIAVGASVVRALESAAAGGAAVRAGRALTDLRIDAAHVRRAVDGVLTGIHDATESHFALLECFVDRATLDAATAEAQRRGYRNHEFGDAMLIVGGMLSEKVSPRADSAAFEERGQEAAGARGREEYDDYSNSGSKSEAFPVSGSVRNSEPAAGAVSSAVWFRI